VAAFDKKLLLSKNILVHHYLKFLEVISSLTPSK